MSHNLSELFHKITIILSTHNGERFISECIESILSQTNTSFHLIIYDDASSDHTVDFIKDYAHRYPDKISYIQPLDSHMGALSSFAYLMGKCSTQYLMFCDQDDIWMPEKIHHTIDRMLSVEKKYGKNIPILIHSDLKVVDNQLNLISNSLWKYQNINPKGRETLNRLLLQNVVTGCTVMINSKLIEMSLPIPKHAIMHDWWLALVASAFGKIEHIHDSTILYRQHQHNKIGATQWADLRNITSFAMDRSRMKTSILNSQLQAKLFLCRYHDKLTPTQQNLITTFISLQKFSKPVRIFKLLKYGILKIGFLRNLGLFSKI